MGRFLKAAAVVALLLFAGVVVAPVAVRRALPPERVRGLLASAARRRWHREVRLGEISVGLVSGVTIRDAAVSEAPDFSAGTFASVGVFSAGVRWAPLLRGRLVIDAVSADALRVRVSKRPDGSYNFSDLLAAGGSSGDASATLALPSVRLRGGRLSYEEAGGARALELSRLDAALSGFSLSAPFFAQAAGEAAGRWDGRPVSGAASFAGRVDLGRGKPESFSADIRSGEVSFEGFRARIAGRARDLTRPALDVRFSLFKRLARVAQGTFTGTISPATSAAPLSAEGRLTASTRGLPSKEAAALGISGGRALAALEASAQVALSPAGAAFKDLVLKGAFGRLQGAGSVSGLGSARPMLALAGRLELPALTAATAPFGFLPEGVALPPSLWKGSVRLSPGELSASSLRIVAGRSEAEFSGSRISELDAEHSRLQLRIRSRRLVIEELADASTRARALGVVGSVRGTLAADGRLPRPVLRGKLQFQGVGAKADALTLAALSGAASFDERRIEISGLRGRVADGDVSLDLVLKEYAAKPDLEVRGSVTRFDLGRWLAAKAALARPAVPGPQVQLLAPGAPLASRGRITVGRLLHPNADAQELALDWDVSGLGADLRGLNGTARFSSVRGRFSNLGGMGSSKIVKVLLFPLMIVQRLVQLGGLKLIPDFKEVDYTELAGDYLFRNGVMTLRDSRLRSNLGRIKARGEIDLPAERLDVTVTMQVAKVAPLDVQVRGSFEKPTTHVKVVKLLAEPAKLLTEPAKLIKGLIK